VSSAYWPQCEGLAGGAGTARANAAGREGVCLIQPSVTAPGCRYGGARCVQPCLHQGSEQDRLPSVLRCRRGALMPTLHPSYSAPAARPRPSTTATITPTLTPTIGSRGPAPVGYVSRYAAPAPSLLRDLSAGLVHRHAGRNGVFAAAQPSASWPSERMDMQRTLMKLQARAPMLAPSLLLRTRRDVHRFRMEEDEVILRV
jgi:hypothetical protein